MDFLKKYYDKILLAMAFVLVIISGFVLVVKVNQLSERVNRFDILTAQPRKIAYEPSDMHKYVEALDAVEHPAVWAASAIDLFKANAGFSVGVISNKPIAYLRLEQLPFDLLFKAYAWDVAKNRAFNFQISLRDLTRAYFIAAVGDPVKDNFGDTGYRTTKFEHKVESTFNPSVEHNMEIDHSELTLEGPSEKPIVLELGKVHLKTESVATVVCREDPNREIQVRRNQSIQCLSDTYIVVDMNEKQMIIKNQNTGKQDIIEKYQGFSGTGGAAQVPGAPIAVVPPPGGVLAPPGSGR